MPTENEKRWMEAWRRAGPALQRIREEELRAIPPGELESTSRTEPTSGLVIQQRWFIRQRILMLEADRAT